MRIVKSFIFLLLGMAISSICFAQSNHERSTPQLNVASLLAETEYKYVEVRKGLWRVTELPHQGKYLKKLIVFLEPNPSNEFLRISLPLGFLKNPVETAELKEKLNDLNERFKPTEFLLTKATLFAVTDLPANKLDKDMVVKGIEKLAGEADQAFSEVMKFLRLEGEESLGPGRGEGIGMGTGAGPGGSVKPPTLPIPNTSGNSESNVARSVDSRPVILNSVRPSYTEEARKNGVQGSVRLRMLVDETGTVKRIIVVRGLPDGLNEKAIEAGYKIKFKPAMKDGKAVAYWIVVDVEFNLR